tara:strand:+ start:29184 stop:30407 length:1224 start_codon:yes stop_codon:yes gene_type:complete
MKKFFCLALLYVFSAAQKVEANTDGSSSIYLVFREFDVKAEVSLALSELEAAFGKELQTDPTEKIRDLKVELRSYILSHISVKGQDGLPWQINLTDDFSIENLPGEPRSLVFSISLHSTNVQSPRAFSIFTDLIVHKILSHRILVFVKSDWGTGVSSEHTEGIGIVYSGQNEIIVNRGEGSNWVGFLSVFKLGMDRVKTEFYHLMFIFVLLLSMTVSYKNSFFDFFRVLSAFTVGHFLKLLIVAAGAKNLPLRWDEVLFSVTIIIFIFHSFRPLFPGQEWIVAFVFGLVYGFVSSNVISDFGLSAGNLIIGSLGLSLGVLFMQLVIVALFAPWYYIAAKGKFYPVFRNLILLAALIICIVWLSTRLLNTENFLLPYLNTIVEHLEWSFLYTAVGCLLVRYQKPDNIK